MRQTDTVMQTLIEVIREEGIDCHLLHYSARDLYDNYTELHKYNLDLSDSTSKDYIAFCKFWRVLR